MSSQAAKMKKLMKTTILDMARNPAQFARTPGKDFTRKRKLDFTSVVSILLSMSGGSTANSLMDYFKFDPNTASASAFVQQRAKLKPEAMEYLFQRFVQGSPAKKTFRGYRLLAVDGSDLQIFADPNDSESYYPSENGQHPPETSSAKCRYFVVRSIILIAFGYFLYDRIKLLFGIIADQSPCSDIRLGRSELHFHQIISV